jgi:hypothetical protein
MSFGFVVFGYFREFYRLVARKEPLVNPARARGHAHNSGLASANHVAKVRLLKKQSIRRLTYCSANCESITSCRKTELVGDSQDEAPT